MSLRSQGLLADKEGDRIVWIGRTANDMPIVSDIYSYLTISSTSPSESVVFRSIWGNKAQMKMKILLWTVLMNKNTTWNTLQRGGWIGPGFCRLCMVEEENNVHLFYTCKFARTIVDSLRKYFNLSFPSLENTTDFILCWQRRASPLWVISAL